MLRELSRCIPGKCTLDLSKISRVAYDNISEVRKVSVLSLEILNPGVFVSLQQFSKE